MDKELREISKDPRFAGRLKKKTQREKEAHRNLFAGIEEEETFKDRRGRPWSRKPLKYAKQLIEKDEDIEEEEEDYEADKSDSMSEKESSDSEESDSSSRDVLDPEERLIDLQDADWYALVKDAKPIEEETRRLAVQHFDWDNSNAETIFLALESFLPAGSTLEKVTIYPSEYGMKKMAEEEKQGPKEIWEGSDSEKEEEGDNKKEENNDESRNPHNTETDERRAWSATSIQMRRRMRKYQIQRLKYYYAIAEFDSKKTAAAVYDACNDVEFADTGIRFDLRFVPDDMTFSVPPEWAHAVSECCEVNRAKFKPRTVENTALHSTRIALSWDQTPAARTQWLREQFAEDVDPKRLFSKEGKAQLSEYVALSSSGQSTSAPSDVDEPGPAPTVPRIRKHRPPKVPPEELRAALLSAIGEGTLNSSEKKSESEGESDENGEYEDEVYDLDGKKSAADSSEDEEYDLSTTGDDEGTSIKGKSKKRMPSRLFAKGGRKAVSKKYLPEAMDVDEDDEEDVGDDESDLDFDDMDRMSDVDGDDDREIRQKKRRRRDDEDDGEESKTSKKRKKKLAMRKKAQLKKQKIEKSREKIKELWTGENENDSRFDLFLTDPAFGVDQMHKDYKEATEFLNFMRRRRGPMLAAQKKANKSKDAGSSK